MEPTENSAELTLNIPKLLVRTDNDHELLLELLHVFQDGCPALMQKVESAVSREEMQSVARSCHALKGMLANLSAERAAAAALQLEKIASSGQRSQLAGALATLRCEVSALSAELTAYLESTKSK